MEASCPVWKPASTCFGRAWSLAISSRRLTYFLCSGEERHFMNRKALLIIPVLAGVAAVAAYSINWFHHDTALQGSGTIEARNIRVGSKVGGRIDQVLVREGDRVHAGQVLVTFDDKEMAAELEQSKATSDKMARGYRPEEIAEARAAAAQAKAEYEQR